MKSCSFRLISDNVVTVVCDCEPCFVIINRLHEFSFSSCLLLTTVELAINYVLWWCIDCMIAVLSHFASTSPDLQSGCISTAFQLEIWAKFLIWGIFLENLTVFHVLIQGPKLETLRWFVCAIHNFPLLPFLTKLTHFLSSALLTAFNGRFLSEEEKEGGNLELLISHSFPPQRVNRAVECKDLLFFL